MSPYLTIKQAAEYLHAKPASVRNWMNGGLLRPDGRAGPRGEWLFLPANLARFAHGCAGRRANPGAIMLMEKEWDGDEKDPESSDPTSAEITDGSYMSKLRTFMAELDRPASTSRPSTMPRSQSERSKAS